MGRPLSVRIFLHFGVLSRSLTIGQARGEVLSLAWPAAVELPRALPALGLGGRPLQHGDDVHAVDAPQGHVQTLHWGDDDT